jgi:hypothetical protein
VSPGYVLIDVKARWQHRHVVELCQLPEKVPRRHEDGGIDSSIKGGRPAADAPAATQRAKICSGAHARACLSWMLHHTVEKTRFIRLAKRKAMRLGTAITLSCIALAASAVPALAQGTPPCSNPNALGLARTVEVDTTGGPGFGFEQYKAHDFLVLKEVVLTFDDGPWPVNTRAVLEALAEHLCEGDILPHRQARPVAPGDPQGGRSRRPYDRRPHLVACQSRRQHEGMAEARREKRRAGKIARGQVDRGNRERFQRHQAGNRRPTGPVLPLPVPEGPEGSRGLPGHTQHRRLLS